jgi:hypothetical protein
MVNPQPVAQPSMTLSQQKSGFPTPAFVPAAISPVESMLYMGDLLENMRKMAQAQGLGVLAHLLELARVEATLVRQDVCASQPSRPGGG